MFDDLIKHPRILVGLEQQSLVEPTNIQRECIPPILNGKDVLACAETGSGKTLAFGLPIMQKLLEVDARGSATRALILSPTRELAYQIYKVFKSFCDLSDLNAGLLTGGDDFKYQAAVLRKNPEIIVATPGRLVDHLKRDSCDLSDLEFLVLDEADRMLDMGFAEDMAVISKACSDQHQTLMFSATLKHKGVEKIAANLLVSPISITTQSIREQHNLITQQQLLADDVAHKERLLFWLLANETFDKAIIFCNKRIEAERLQFEVRRHREGIALLHGEMTQDERRFTIEQFRNGQRQVLIATDVAARGLDIDGVDLVVNFDMARKGDDYVHRIGRTGRAGNSGKSISLIMPNEWNLKASIERYLQVRFENRVIKALQGNYKGPRKLKSSGKAASLGKRKKSSTGGRGNRAESRRSAARRRGNLMDSQGMAPIRKRNPSQSGNMGKKTDSD